MNPTLLAATGLLALASVTRGMDFALSPTVLGLFASAWVLSATAPSTPVGTFPTAAVFYLLLLWLVSPTALVIAVAVGYLLAVVVKGGQGLQAELRLGVLPLLAAAAVTNLLLAEQPLPMLAAAGGLVYLLTLNLCAGWQAEQPAARQGLPWAELRWAFLRSSAVLPLLAAMGAALVPQHPAWILCLAIVGWFQAYGAVTELVRSQLKPMSEQLRSTREREQRWVARLKTLEGLSRRLTRADSVELAVNGIVATVKDYCQPDSVAVHPGARQPAPRQSESHTFSMADAGWLEVEGELSEEQSGLLATLATTAGFALKMVQARQSRLQSVTRERDQMEAWLKRLRVLLEASQSMASSLSIASVLDTAGAVLGRMVPQAQHAVVCLEPPSRRASTGMPEIDGWLDRVAAGQSGSLESGLLALPVLFEGRLRGALLVSGSVADPLDQELLKIFAYQLGGAFERARLYQQIVVAEAQVVQASKMAAVGQLAAGVAHELNTPLGSMMMAIEYADQTMEKQPERARKRLELATRSGEKARSIISKLLHYSREAKLEDQEVSLAAMATDAAELLTHHLERSGMQLVMELGPCAPVRGNENELHQVFSNLVLNSRDALLQGDYPKEIRVRLWQEGNEARLAVMDRGPGIPDEVLPHIFEPFFTTRPMGGEGAGLGLSVSQQIVSKHQGRLAVSTRPGETVFTLILPTI